MSGVRHKAGADIRHLRNAAEMSLSSSSHLRPDHLWDVDPGPVGFDLRQSPWKANATSDGLRLSEIANAIVQVGNCDGRGFIVGGVEGTRYVVSAAHCLQGSRYQRPNLAFDTSDWTLSNVMGPLGAERGTISAGLCLVNLTDDIAVFGEPDSQEFAYAADQYERFTTVAMPVAAPPAACEPHRWRDAPGSKAWVFSLDGMWLPCSIHNDNGRSLTLSGVEIKAGMSGSPVLDADGAAIGVISAVRGEGGDNNGCPNLMDCLPAWLWRKLQSRC